MPGAGRFVRENAFLVAAVSLPILVVGFFLLATAVPRWRVPPPAYDLVLRADRYSRAPATVAVDFRVRDDRVVATVRPVPPNTFPPQVALLLFDHRTQDVREIPLDLPEDLAEGDPPRTVAVEALAGRRVITDPRAPDGYELDMRTTQGPGVVGDLFGMRRHGQRVALVNRGRVISLDLPAPYQHSYRPTLQPVGWIVE